MIKAGIFLDVQNLTLNGGWGMRYDVIRQLVRAQEATVLRANAYFAVDAERERNDPEYYRREEEYRNAIRRANFHLVLKEIRRYRNEDGEVLTKANADLELAVDAVLQSQNLDYVLLGSGDGDFVRLVQALQNTGKRVDLLSFGNTSGELRRIADYHFSGFLIPRLTHQYRGDGGRMRGILHAANEEKGYGFITARTGLGINDTRADIFCHINDVIDRLDNERFARLKTNETILEFDLEQQEDGRARAVNVSVFDWQDEGRRPPASGGNGSGPSEHEARSEESRLDQ